jgi:hypothetical protein
MHINIFKSVIHLNPYSTITIRDFHWEIKSGHYESQIRELRNLSSQEQSFYKTKNLPAATISGTFKTRRDDALINHSGLICVDIDKLEFNDVNHYKDQLVSQLQHQIVMCFISPSGRGIKVIFKVNPFENNQQANYEAACLLIQSKIPELKSYIDNSCKNVSRLCFVSHDPKAFLNKNAIKVNSYSNIPALETTLLIKQSRSKSILEATQNLEYHRNNVLDIAHKSDRSNFLKLVGMTTSKHGTFVIGNRHIFIQRLCSLANKFGMDQKVLSAHLQDQFMKNEQSVIQNNEFKCSELEQILEDTYSRYENQFNTWDESESDDEVITPMFPTELYDVLPNFLATCCSQFSERERDVFLVGALGVLSNCFPLIHGTYDGKAIGMNLFLFISAPASAGKGALHWARRLCRSLDQEIKSDYETVLQQYEIALKEYEATKTEGAIKPKKPLRPQLYIPGNSSTSSIISAMHNNGNYGLIFETEADTLTSMLKVEWGNFSDIIRKAFHHEPITLLRKTNDEHLELDRSYLSMVLSGTPKQVENLLSSIENGFFSRFLFYSFSQNIKWKNVFEVKDFSMEKFFEARSNVLNSYCKPFFGSIAEDWANVSMFKYSDLQQQRFQDYFSSKILQLNNIYGTDIIASVKRLAVCFFKISMLITTLRVIEEAIDGRGQRLKEFDCRDVDFEITKKIVDTLLLHTINVFRQLKKKNRNKFNYATKQAFYDNLPEKFNRIMAMDLASYIGLKEKTAEKYLTDFIEKDLLSRPEHNSYLKLT